MGVVSHGFLSLGGKFSALCFLPQPKNDGTKFNIVYKKAGYLLMDMRTTKVNRRTPVWSIVLTRAASDIGHAIHA